MSSEALRTIRRVPPVALRGMLFTFIVAGLIIGVLALAAAEYGQPVAMLGYVLVFWVYIAAGVLGIAFRPFNPIGALLVFCGYACLLGGLGSVGPPSFQALGRMFEDLPLAIVVHLLHAYPSGRLRDRTSRVIVIAGYFVAIGVPPNWREPLFGSSPIGFQMTQLVLGAAVMIATAIVLGRRVRHAAPRQRVTAVTLYTVGILTVVLIPTLGALRTFAPDDATSTLFALSAQLAVVGALPVLFALAVVGGRFPPTAEGDQLVLALREAERGHVELLDVMRWSLGDETIELLDPQAARDIRPERGRARVTARVERREVCAVDYDAQLNPDEEVVLAHVHVFAIALDRERLVDELKQTQRRLVGAEDRERRRIAQDLHDGVQTDLVLLSTTVGDLRRHPEVTSDVRRRLGKISTRLAESTNDIRLLVHGIMPSSLVERGLVPAIEDLLDRIALPVQLSVDSELEPRLPKQLESAAYFVVAECLGNVIKHAGARSATVTLRRLERSGVVIVSDDGRGGAALVPGHGLSGLADRIGALDGRFDVRSDRNGTVVTVELPCVS